MTQREFAIEVLTQLRAAGHEALLAGGCVRDQLLGREPKDYDVATSARPDAVRELFGQRRTLAIGAAFGVIAVLGRRPLTPIDVATFRTDGMYRDGRRPETVEFADAEHDAQRRDFTINGLFYDPVADEVVDYVGGQQDLAAGLIRAIGDPLKRFADDKLRMLRAVRFATTLDFAIDPATLAAMRQMAPEAAAVSGERNGAELRRVLTHDNCRRGVKLLSETELLQPLLPEIAAAREADPAWWAAALARLDRLRAPTLATALAALAIEGVSTPDLRALARRLRLPNKDTDRAAWLHTHLPIVADAATIPWPRLQRVLIHAGAEELIALAAAALGADDPGLARCREQLKLPIERWNPPPLVTGDDLKAHRLKPGPQFAALLEYVRDEQLEGRLASRAEALAAAQRWIAANRPGAPPQR
jgi:tRNA nucleotidyltransferase/poly(A) polymerase